MADPAHYVVVSSKAWTAAAFERFRRPAAEQWSFIARAEELTEENLARLDPRYVFFLHWSSKVPRAITDKYDCVCFHMTDVPYGRGGSPLQNLILRGHTDTVLSALRMVEQFDAGPVYLKRPLSLAGSAREIYERTTDLSFDMIRTIIDERPIPAPQIGEPVIFQRRRPEQSEIPADLSPEKLYDFVRMLDAKTYPHAFVDHGAFRIELTRATLTDGQVHAHASFVRRKDVS